MFSFTHLNYKAICNLALDHPMQEGKCRATIISGNTADVSHLVDFSIYDWCWVLSPTHSSQDNKQLCCWLGPSFKVGSDLCFVCLTARGRYLHCTSVIPLNALDWNNEDTKELSKKFTEELIHNLPRGCLEPIRHGDLDEIDLHFMHPLDGENDDLIPEFEKDMKMTMLMVMTSLLRLPQTKRNTQLNLISMLA